MNFLEILQAVSRNAGIREPQAIDTGDTDQIKLTQFINEAGAEAVRRVDWGALRKAATITGTGSASDHSIASDYSRMSIGSSVSCDGNLIRGSLSPDEWFSLTPVSGDPRYYYLRGDRIAFYPYLGSGKTAHVQYQGENWVNSGAKDRLSLADDTALIPDTLLVLGGVWRWRRHVGKDYADHMAEFEAALMDEARFDAGMRSP